MPKIDKTYSAKHTTLYYAVIYTAFILVLLSIEGIVRLTFPHIPSIQFFVMGPTHGDDSAGAATFEGDPLLGWRFKPNLQNVWWDFTFFSTNEQHLRHPGPIVKKDDTTFRIVCLGDSVTFGYRVPVSFPEHPDQVDPKALPFARLLENRLPQFHDKNIEVIALAVPGYTSHQGFAWLNRDIVQLEPNLLIVSFGWNDTDYRPIEDKASLPNQSWKVTLRWLVSQSQAIMQASRWYTSLTAREPAAKLEARVHRVSEQDYLHNMAAIAALSKDHGAHTIMMGPFYRDAVTHPPQAQAITAYREKLRAFDQNDHITYLAIPELTEAAHPHNGNLFGEVIHPNHLGHQLIAERLIGLLRKTMNSHHGSQ